MNLLERRRNDIDSTADRKLRASVIRANSARRALMSSSAFRAEDSLRHPTVPLRHGRTRYRAIAAVS